MIMFTARAKKYDPDDETSSDPEPALALAVAWCHRQQPYGYRSFWISDGSVEVRLEDVPNSAIATNRLYSRPFPTNPATRRQS